RTSKRERVATRAKRRVAGGGFANADGCPTLTFPLLRNGPLPLPLRSAGEGNKILRQRYADSFSFRRWLSRAGLALPPVVFITWPTKKPNSFSLPARYSLSLSACWART